MLLPFGYLGGSLIWLRSVCSQRAAGTRTHLQYNCMNLISKTAKPTKPTTQAEYETLDSLNISWDCRFPCSNKIVRHGSSLCFPCLPLDILGFWPNWSEGCPTSQEQEAKCSLSGPQPSCDESEIERSLDSCRGEVRNSHLAMREVVLTGTADIYGDCGGASQPWAATDLQILRGSSKHPFGVGRGVSIPVEEF